MVHPKNASFFSSFVIKKQSRLREVTDPYELPHEDGSVGQPSLEFKNGC